MKRSAAITALVVSLGLLSACTPEAEETPSPTPSVTTTDPTASTTPPSDPPTTTSPTPSPSPTPSETLDADQQAARDVVNEFFRLSDELAQNPDLPLQPLADITRGQTQTVYLQEIATFREKNAVQIGDTEWRFVSIATPSQATGETLVTVVVCTDSSNLDIVDRETETSILPKDRPTLVSWTIDAASPTGSRWFVGDLTSVVDDGCSV